MKRLIVSADVERYLMQLAGPRHPVLAEMEERAAADGFPIVGPLVGRLLQVMVRSVGALRVFEMGSGYGYSAAHMLLAMPEQGRLVYTDTSESNAAAARLYLGQLGVLARAQIEVGEALTVLEHHQGPFDLIFCDIDKERYPDVPELAVERLREGGLLVFDNCLWKGQVTQAEPLDRTTRSVQALNLILNHRQDLLTAIIPLRDGVSVSVKLR